jgi:hypothetical protein
MMQPIACSEYTGTQSNLLMCQTNAQGWKGRRSPVLRQDNLENQNNYQSPLLKIYHFLSIILMFQHILEYERMVPLQIPELLEAVSFFFFMYKEVALEKYFSLTNYTSLQFNTLSFSEEHDCVRIPNFYTQGSPADVLLTCFVCKEVIKSSQITAETRFKRHFSSICLC